MSMPGDAVASITNIPTQLTNNNLLTTTSQSVSAQVWF